MSRGFTLLEVLIAITLIAFLSVFTTQSIQRAMKTRAKVQHTVDLNGQMRETLRLIERDINLAFHHRDYATDLYNKAEQARRGNQPGGSPPTPPNPPGGGPPKPPTPTPGAPLPPFTPKAPPPQLTMLIGDGATLNLTTLTRARTLTDEQASSQQKVGYFLKDCRSRKNRTQRSKCLWRRTDPFLDDDVTKGGVEAPLLENVDTIAFRYLPELQEEWRDKWNSKEGLEDEKDRFPAAIEVTLTVVEPPPKGSRFAKPNKVVMQTVAAIRFPNNPKENANDPAQGAATPTGP